jgi:D-glycero-D-manno-heptose 1,7-bisphosphate phosphatase
LRLCVEKIQLMKLIILDRDGVINEDSDDYIKSLEEFIFIPGSLEAIARLSKAGYKIAVATNQSGIARGYYDRATLEAMHRKLQRELAAIGGRVDMITFCPHGPDDNCACRKPKPGLYLQIAEHFQTQLEEVPVIGDSLRDIMAAREVSAYPMLVRTGKGERTLARGEGLDGVPVFNDLASAVDNLLQGN